MLKMSHHWESSARPLFVKTVYVNGSRHAILSQKDPLLQSDISLLRKQIRSHSSLSFSSVYSTNTLSSESEISFRIPKTRQPSSKDISSDLQRCLVKWNLSPAAQDEKVFGGDAPQKINGKSVKKKEEISNGKTSNKHEVESNLMDESKVESLSERSDERNIESFRRQMELYSQRDGTNWTGNDWTENFDADNEIAEAEKSDSVLGETFHKLIMRNRKNEGIQTDKSLECFYNSKTCELYWNNYLARSSNTSLTERVVQWIDLAKKRRKQEQNSMFPLMDTSKRKNHSEKCSRKNMNTTKIRKNDENGERKSEVETSSSDERAILNRQNSSSSNTETNVEDNDSHDIISFLEKIEMEKPKCKTDEIINKKSSPFFYGNCEIKKNPTILSSFFPGDSKSFQIETLQKSIENQLQPSMSITPKSLPNKPEDKNESITKRCLNRKKNQKSGQEYFLRGFGHNDEYSKTQKRTVSAKNQRHDSFEKGNVCRGNLKGRLEKSEEERTKFKNQRTWMSTVIDENYISVHKANFTHHLLNQHFLLQQKQQQKNNILQLRESKIAWDSEKCSEKPQLHIFIPSISQRELNESGNVSDCEFHQ